MHELVLSIIYYYEQKTNTSRVSLYHIITQSPTETRSVVSGSPKVPPKATALNPWMVVDRRWKRNAVSLIYLVFCMSRLPMSSIKSIQLLLIGPMVYKATGTKWWLSIGWSYLVIFLVATNSIAAPDAAIVYYGNVPDYRLRSPRHGFNVSASALFRSEQSGGPHGYEALATSSS